MGILSKLMDRVLFGTRSTDDSVAEAIQSTSHKLHVANMAEEPGHDAQADMTWGGPRAELYAVTADAQVITGPCWVYAVRTNTAGTTSTLDLYNGTNTSGGKAFVGVPTATINVAGYRSPIAAEGVAVYCPDGLYADVGGTGSPNFTVFALAAQP